MKNYVQNEPELYESRAIATDIDEIQNRKKEQLLLNQNLPFGVVAGILAGLIGAVLWAVITVSTEYQIGYMAIGIGFLVGFGIRTFGKGIEPIFGILGAVVSLASCILGNLFTIVGFVSKEDGTNPLQMLGYIDYSVVPSVMIESFQPMDILFYGIAVWAGYKYSFLKRE